MSVLTVAKSPDKQDINTLLSVRVNELLIVCIDSIQYNGSG